MHSGLIKLIWFLRQCGKINIWQVKVINYLLLFLHAFSFLQDFFGACFLLFVQWCIKNLKSNFDEKGFLKFKLNTKLNQDFLKLDLFSRGLNLENSEYIIGNRKISFKEGTFKSNFKFNRSSKRIFCEGKFSFTNLKIKPEEWKKIEPVHILK